MEAYHEAFVAFDVAEPKHAVAVAEGDRSGRSGIDTLDGGGGNDTLRGGTGGDRLDFRGLGLTFNSSSNFTGGGQASVVATQESGIVNTFISIDGNGDALADHEIVLLSVSKLNIDASDFLLV